MAILTAADFMQNITTPTITGSGFVRRVPFSFTSTARMIKSGKLDAVGSHYAQMLATTQRDYELAAIEDEVFPPKTTLTAGRDLLTSIVPTQNLTPVISMAVNPHSVKWTQTKRFSKRDTMEGSVFFHSTNSADQNNDILTCTFTGRTGNINTKVNPVEALVIGSNEKLRIWHELYNLSREAILLNEGNTGAAVKSLPPKMRNEFFITYRTTLMQIPITLIGFFNQVLEFTEDASDPFNRVYSFSFTVTDTSPKLDDLSSKLGSSLVSGNLVNTVI